MDAFLCDIQYALFIKYVYYHLNNVIVEKDNFGTYIVDGNDKYCIFFSHERIVEIKIEEPNYYLHFLFQDFLNANILFQDFCKFITPRKPKKILICCSSAMTSSYLKEKLEKSVKENGDNINFYACGVTDAMEKGKYMDLILFAPQVRYQAKKMPSSYHFLV